MARRSYGSGSVYVRTDAAGVESWYGTWYVEGCKINRKLGAKRLRGSRDGLTAAQAERELRRRIDSERPVVRSRLTVEIAADRYLDHLENVLERRPTTIGDYSSMKRKHLEPFFGERPLERVDADDIRRYLRAKRREGLATKTITNQLVFLHGLFSFAVKRRWVAANPVANVDRPRAPEVDPDIRFLDLTELEALLRAVDDKEFGATDRPLYLTAAMTGLRQGELIALRWSDVDWPTARIRVRRNYTRQAFGKPKSKRSSRSVPMTDRVAGELERHFKRTAFDADEDLVFPHPHTGGPLDASKVRKRYKKVLVAAALRDVRFHDLRHTFGTHCAAAGVPMRTLQEWMGHRDIKTTLIYADYAPSAQEKEMVERAFSPPALDEGEGDPDSPREEVGPESAGAGR
jgi:integrase